MFGLSFDGSDEIEGLKSFLKRIASNDETGKLTHKEVRAYARCMLPIISHITIGGWSLNKEAFWLMGDS